MLSKCTSIAWWMYSGCKATLFLNVDRLPSGQLHSLPLPSGSYTGVRLAHGRRTYACVPAICACAGLTHGRRTYALALDLGTGART